jgi:two-component system nitrogen regulation response regulator NtrX
LRDHAPRPAGDRAVRHRAQRRRPEGVSKVGFLEQAHSGTLLLDEVADMPLETQGKIVRVLQEQTFERVGGKTKVDVDVRVIAATSRDLQAEMSNGSSGRTCFIA